MNTEKGKDKYTYYEIWTASDKPTEKGTYYGKTPILEQALGVARAIGGNLYGITADGHHVYIWFDVTDITSLILGR